MDDQTIRDFLQRNPDVLRDFLTRESRLSSPWLNAYINKLVRIGAMENLAIARRC